MGLQYHLTLTEEDNWLGPDGVTKDKVMLVNGMRKAVVRISTIHY